MRVWQRRSLSSRLTLWYGLSAFLLVIGTATYLYLSLQSTMALEDHQIILEKVRTLRILLDRHATDDRSVLDRTQEWSNREYERIYVRIAEEISGRVVVQTGPVSVLSGEKITPAVAVLRDADDGRVYRIETRRVTGGVPVIVSLALDRTESENLLESYRRRLLVIAALSFVACLWVGRSIARKGVQPILDISGAAQRINSSNLSARIKLEDLPVEFSNLAATFNTMLDRLEDHLKRLGRFSADIAHELRTPIHNMIGEFGVTLTKSRSPAEYQDALGSGIEECEKIAKIIEALLLVARAENPGASITKETLDLNAELLTLKEFYQSLATEKNITLKIEVERSLTLNANKTLLQRAVANLLSNALAHTPAGGLVVLSARRDGRQTLIEVRDSGSGIDERHLGRIFDRFYRIDESRSKDSGGTGLGLAIFKGIVTLHGGQVSIASQLGAGTSVSFTLPE